MENNSPKRLEDILNNKKFGNLSIIVPLMILVVGIIIVISSFFAGGGSHEAGTRSIELLATVVTLATTGSLASYGFKSQTKIDLENYVNSLNPSTIDTEDGDRLLSLPANSVDVSGDFNSNVVEHSDSTGTEPIESMSAETESIESMTVSTKP